MMKTYRSQQVVLNHAKKRREGQPQRAINIADQAGVRLRRRYYRLINQGKIPCKAVVAIARELAGFIWFILTEHQKKTANAA